MTKTLGQCVTQRDNNFNLIRMLAASGVILSHTYPITLGGGTPEPLEYLLKGDNLGRLCVFVFFAVSGYLITTSFDRRRSIIGFIRARVLRIYPAYVVMLILMLPLVGLLNDQPAAYYQMLPHWMIGYLAFLYVSTPTLFVDNPLPQAFNGSLWTLRYEVLCYGAVLVAGSLGLLRRRYLALGLLGGAVLAYYVLPLVTGRTDLRLLSYVGMPFAFGAAAYVWRDSLVLDGRIALGLLALAAALWVTPLFFAAMIAFVTYTVLWMGYADTPVLHGYNRFGDYSYGVYIYAFPIQQLIAKFLPDLGPLAAAGLAFCITMVFAFASWHAIERPALRMKTIGVRPRILGDAERGS